MRLSTPILLLVAACSAVLIATGHFRDAKAQARAEAERLQQVEAVLTTPGATKAAAVKDQPQPGRAEATWLLPSGVAATGRVPVPADARAGSTVTIWIDESGALARPPRSDADLHGSAITIGVGSMAGLSFAAVAVLAEVGRRVERRAEALWEPEWERVEPVWSRRSPGAPEDRHR